MKNLIFVLLVLGSFSSFASAEDPLYLEIKDLSVDCHSQSNICKGDIVLHEQRFFEIELVDVQGRVVLKKSKSYHRGYTDVKRISKVVYSYGGLKPHDRVILEGNVREVQAVDNKGSILLYENARFYRHQLQASKVSKIVDSHMGFKACDKVLMPNDTIREIEFVDNKGLVVIKETPDHQQEFIKNRLIRMVEPCSFN